MKESNDQIFAFKELNVWQKSIDFADTVIDLIDNLETDRKHFRLIEQLESAVASIAQNIAEGKGRNSKKEFTQFLYIARGSVYETITLLVIFQKRGWISEETLQELEASGKEIIKMIKGFINYLNK